MENLFHIDYKGIKFSLIEHYRNLKDAILAYILKFSSQFQCYMCKIEENGHNFGW